MRSRVALSCLLVFLGIGLALGNSYGGGSSYGSGYGGGSYYGYPSSYGLYGNGYGGYSGSGHGSGYGSGYGGYSGSGYGKGKGGMRRVIIIPPRVTPIIPGYGAGYGAGAASSGQALPLAGASLLALSAEENSGLFGGQNEGILLLLGFLAFSLLFSSNTGTTLTG